MSEKTYQMLWDCPNCGTDKLLGVNHRHCPNCGSPQNPAWRYFPPDDQKIAVEDHVFQGADKLCPACETPNSIKATFCGGCGSPLEGAKAAKVRSDQIVAEGESFVADSAKNAKQDFAAQKAASKTQPAVKKKNKVPWVVLGAIVAVVVTLVMLFTWKKTAQVVVIGHSWERTIAIERFQPGSDSSWCDSLPFDAYQVSRKREVRDHKQVPDGETCSTRRKDQGDGTYKESRECKPKYRDEPIYADKCYYQINRWTKVRSERTAGEALTPAPVWPAVTLAHVGQCLGCEREGARGQSYKVLFREEPAERAHDCSFDEAKWSTFKVGSRFASKVSVVTHSLACDELKAQP